MVYNYTRPRGPIAAMNSSPGPVYMLPSLVGYFDHDATRTKTPAWGFGRRVKLLHNDSSPGPVHLPDSRLTRNGVGGGLQFSIYSRPNDLKLFSNPGPQKYNTNEAYNNLKGSGLKFSFGQRVEPLKGDKNPGPNVYTLDPMIGQTVQSNKKSALVPSLKGRCKQGGFDEDLKKTPGPGTYNIPDSSTYRVGLPKWSLLSRHFPPGDNTMKPAPSAYNPNNDEAVKKAAPKYSFGIRHSQYKGEYITDTDA